MPFPAEQTDERSTPSRAAAKDADGFGSANWLSDADAFDALHRCLAECLTTPPTEGPQSPPPPITRRWCAQLAPTGAYIIERHPAMRGVDAPAAEPKRLARAPNRGWRGKLPDRKSGRTLAGHSQLELELLEMAQVEPEWDDLVEHPVRLRFTVGNQLRSFVPSLYAAVAGQPWLFRCAWEDTASRPENEVRWKAAGEAFAALGYNFEVLTERHLRRQPRRSNISELLRCRLSPEPTDREIELARETAGRGFLSLNEVAVAAGITEEQARLLVLNGLLACDLDLPLEEAVVRAGPRTMLRRRR